MSDGVPLLPPAAQVAAGRLCPIHRSIESASHVVQLSYFQSRTNDFHWPCVVSGWTLFALWMQAASRVLIVTFQERFLPAKDAPSLCFVLWCETTLHVPLMQGTSRYYLFTSDTILIFPPLISAGTTFNPIQASYGLFFLWCGVLEKAALGNITQIQNDSQQQKQRHLLCWRVNHSHLF